MSIIDEALEEMPENQKQNEREGAPAPGAGDDHKDKKAHEYHPDFEKSFSKPKT